MTGMEQIKCTECNTNLHINHPLMLTHALYKGPMLAAYTASKAEVKAEVKP
jgi:hypothetical protein